MVDYFAHRIHLKNLGVSEINLNDPNRQIKMRVKREIQIVYENIVNPRNIGRRSTLADLEINHIECGGNHRHCDSHNHYHSFKTKIKSKMQVRFDRKVTISLSENLD